MQANFQELRARLIENAEGQSGQGMIEYGLLVALISVAAIVVIVLIGPQLLSTFQSVVNAL
ncbi:MAG TPA: Flp family type IVb pilin [Chloroflexota bacterium]|nr:Flp family type IVb pilin [Chloroflexota bacterium]